MVTMTNPILEQVLHRRRMLRLARWSAAAWVLFGAAHIVAWTAAFEHGFSILTREVPTTQLVWPLLLAATACFALMVFFGARYFLTPEER